MSLLLAGPASSAAFVPPPRFDASSAFAPCVEARVRALHAVQSTSADRELGHRPENLGELLRLSQALFGLQASALTLAQLTDAIDHPVDRPSDDAGSVWNSSAEALKRFRRKQLLEDLLRSDRAAYVETVSFLSIPRTELPNRQDIPMRPCDGPSRLDPTQEQQGPAGAVVDLGADGLVPDCTLPAKAMGENPLEATLLEVTRDIYASEASITRSSQGGILGLIDEMRRFMLSPQGLQAATQQEVLLKTLRRLMTGYLPPFYRIFMGGIVPSYNPDDTRVGADPKWLADAFGWVRAKLPAGKEYLEPGRQLGPWFYAPALTSVVAPYAFGFLVGPASLNLRSDGRLGGLVVEKCKFLQESNCKGMCLNSCKQPAQELFAELGLPLRVSPNFETQECQWSFGEAAPLAADDPTWPKGCIEGCTSREAIKELTGQSVRVCE